MVNLKLQKEKQKAKIVLAEGNQEAIEKVKSAIQNNELPAIFILGEKYINALGKIYRNQKIVNLCYYRLI